MLCYGCVCAFDRELVFSFLRNERRQFCMVLDLNWKNSSIIFYRLNSLATKSMEVRFSKAESISVLKNSIFYCSAFVANTTISIKQLSHSRSNFILKSSPTILRCAISMLATKIINKKENVCIKNRRKKLATIERTSKWVNEKNSIELNLEMFFAFGCTNKVFQHNGGTMCIVYMQKTRFVYCVHIRACR